MVSCAPVGNRRLLDFGKRAGGRVANPPRDAILARNAAGRKRI
jgi:hypothetical protein